MSESTPSACPRCPTCGSLTKDERNACGPKRLEIQWCNNPWHNSAPAAPQEEPVAPNTCEHKRLDEDGICRQCGINVAKPTAPVECPHLMIKSVYHEENDKVEWSCVRCKVPFGPVAPLTTTEQDNVFNSLGAGEVVSLATDETGIKLHQTMDAVIWAKEFKRICDNNGHYCDEEWMVTWFANAIMTGHDHAARETAALSEQLVITKDETRDRLRQWNADLHKRIATLEAQLARVREEKP